MNNNQFGNLSIPATLIRSITVALGLAGSLSAHAAVTDCEGMSVDGQAKCILPNYAPTQYTVCDIEGSTQIRTNIWNSCYTSAGNPNPILQEGTAVSLADCFDKIQASIPKPPISGGVGGSVPWLPVGTSYSDNLCIASATVRDVDGHHIFGVGTLTGGTARFAFTRREAPSCPTGYTSVFQTINGFSELVRCKPVLSCPPDQELIGTACRSVVTVDPALPPPPHKCMDARNPNVGDPIYPLSGAMSESTSTGLRLSGIEFVINYTTGNMLKGRPLRVPASFGRLWSSNLHRNLVIGTGAATIVANRGDGSAVSFALKNGAYAPDANVNDRVVAVTGGYLYTDARNSRLETYDTNGQLKIIEAADGSFLTFSYNNTATSTAPAPGYLTQVTDNAGHFLKFEYIIPPGSSEAQATTSGVVSKVTNAAGEALLASYDANRNLASITWPDNKAVQFMYEDASLPWALTGRMDENGSRHATWSYDQQGRAVATSLAAGVQAYQVSYDTPPQYVVTRTLDSTLNLMYQRFETQSVAGTTVTGPNGQTSAWSSTPVFGTHMLTGSSQPAGSGCGAALNQVIFDTLGNISSRDDFQGIRTCYAYDTSNREITRVEGLSNTASCAAVLPTGATLPPGARKITTQWHPNWRLPAKVTSPGQVVTTVYQGQIDPATSTAANCTTAPLMSNGTMLPLVCKVISQSTTDSTTQTFTYTYDDSGNRLTVTDALGSQERAQYVVPDPGIDQAFNRVRVLLHGDGADGSNVFVDSSSPVKNVVIAHGTPTNSASNKKFGAASLFFPGSSSLRVSGVGTSFWNSDWTVEFWVLPGTATQGHAAIMGNRDNSAAGFGGGALDVSYSAGLLTDIFFELTENSSFSNFGVGTSNNGFTSARSNVGNFNQITVTKQGLTYTFFLNGIRVGAVTRPVEAKPSPFADLFVGAADQDSFFPFYFNGYLDDFRITMGDARYVKNYIPRTLAFPDVGVNPGLDPALFNLQSVTNAAGQITRYTQYDTAGRLRQTIDPKGVVSDITYTPRGFVSSVTVTPPGLTPRTTGYTYDAAGQLTQVAQPDGTTLGYSYDAAHRLVGITDERGNAIAYTLDANSNRISEEIRDPTGTLQRTVTRSFDVLNRLQQITGAAK